ncbi:MAG TPA: hypothetical protein VN231_08415 [Allosphingosinicella sp.]|nr:hypothetical protein [Allosphingosinicella sp.]
MNKLLLAMTALAAAAPAAAQYPYQANRDFDVRGGAALSQRIAELESRYEAGVQQGLIDRGERRMLRRQLVDLRQLERQYAYNGFTAQERDDLRQRIRSARQQLRVADNGRFDRDRRYGSWDEDDRDTRYGRWDDDQRYHGQGGPYEAETCERRGGIAGLFQSLIGDDDDDCGLRVGQRVSGNLYGVPYAYRNQFRDGNGVYYRWDGRTVYQIDARSHTVVRAYPLND